MFSDITSQLILGTEKLKISGPAVPFFEAPPI